MVTEMTKYDFILLKGDVDAFLEKLQAVGVVDITRSQKPIDAHSDQLSIHADNYRKALSALKDVAPADQYEKLSGNLAALVLETIAEKETMEAQLSQYYKELEELRPWGRFDKADIEKLKACGMKLHFYKARNSDINPEWKEQYALKEISTDGNLTYFVVVEDSVIARTASEAWRDESIHPFDFPLKELPAPERDVFALEQEIKTLETAIAEKEQYLSVLKSHETEIRATMDKTLSDLDLYLAHASGEKVAENYVTVFEGFAPVESKASLHEMLERENVLYLEDKAKVDDNPPIKLRNNRFVSMFELLTDMYGRPKYDEFDPTVFIAIFFMLFFAFCMGDAGYGLVLILMGFALKKKLPKIAPLGITLGIATTVIGLLFHTFFSTDMLTWTCIPDSVKRFMLPSQIFGYDGTMVLAILVGIVHICLAMIVKTYQSTKVKGFGNSLGTWGWTLLIVGGVIVGGLALMGVMDKTLTKWIVIGLGILSALGIFFLNDLHRNPLKNFGSGLWETYNTATGLLGDVLSYLRLYALGLAGAKLGEAFNAIGLQARGDGGAGWIWFVLIVVIGHALNVAMCVLGAFVHPLRLNFLEFFKNSGYEGSGRNYKPLKTEQLNN